MNNDIRWWEDLERVPGEFLTRVPAEPLDGEFPN